MWDYVVWYKIISVSEEPTSYIFRVEDQLGHPGKTEWRYKHTRKGHDDASDPMGDDHTMRGQG
jgi:predicted secreted protein